MTSKRDERRRPLFSILHTSARPDKCMEIYDAWMGAARYPENVEYILCVDERWGFTSKQGGGIGGHGMPDDQWFNRSLYLNKLVWNTGRRCYVDGVNTAAKAATGQILIVNADDQYPMHHWDSALYQFADALPSKSEFVIQVSTGTPNEEQAGITVMPIMSRARYERLGYLLFPDYESMCSDNDLHDHAVQDDCLIEARQLMFPHHHPLIKAPGVWDMDKMKAYKAFQKYEGEDEQYREQNRKHAHLLGQIILQWRRRIRFGDALKEAHQLEGWMTPEELTWLSRSASQSESIVEIGSWKGRSTYAICSGTTGNVYAVDRWNWRQTGDDESGKHYQMTDPAESPSDVYDDFTHNVVDKFPNVLAVRKDSVEASKTLPDADMVFIDGGHDYDSVKADIQAWLPKTKKLICGHDYSDGPEHADVVRAVNELLGAGVKVVPGTTIWYKFLGSGAPSNGTAIVPNGKVIAWCIPGELFHGVMVRSLMHLYAYLLAKGYYVVVHHTWTSSPYVTREVLRDSVTKMQVRPHLVLWQDDDNPVSPEIFERLLKDIESSDEVSCVFGWTWVDMYNGSFSVSAGMFNEDKTDVKIIPPKMIAKETNLIEVEWSGFPVVLMRYEAMLDAGDKPFAGIPAPNTRWGVSGEDVAFCTNLKARSKHRLFVDPLAFVPHLKYGAIGPDGMHDSGATVEEMDKLEMKVSEK